MKIAWQNRYSGESGFVKAIKVKAGCFENTFDLDKARKFKSRGEVDKALATLTEIGEAQNNDFRVID